MLIVLQPKVNSESFFLSLLDGASALIIYHQDLKLFNKITIANNSHYM